MEIRVLGCYGGEAPGHHTTCFLIDGKVVIDAGALTSALSLRDQAKIDAVILTHSHLDHIRDLGFLADNIFGKRDKPVQIWGLPETIRDLKSHILNNAVWPDFCRLPTPENPVLTCHELKEGIPAAIGGITITAVKVNHTIPAAGFIVNNGASAFAISGDTGPTTAFWEEAAKNERLAALFLETSFPNRMESLAELTGHLTPNMAGRELAKLGRDGLKVRLYHMKPQYLKEIMAEVEALGDGVEVARQGEEIEI